MEVIREMVDTIINGCDKGGIKVSDVLAAFIARTVVEKNSSRFSLDAPLTPDSTREVILTSIERLLQRDDPSLETMKMQVDYDKTFIDEEMKAQHAVRSRNKLISAHKMAIIDFEMAEGGDFESLTTLYRQIFRFLLDFVGPAKGENKVLEREVAAALESVFPRIGLKAFVQLKKNEKETQLQELARIVLGIRLFNKNQGRGGAGIDNIDSDAFGLSTELYTEINGEIEAFADACNRYEKAIVNSKRIQRQTVNDELNPVDPKDDAKSSQFGYAAPQVESKIVDRWCLELANRRQYLGFLRTLQEELYILQQKILQLHESIQGELVNIKKLVSDKNSVPKEVIYPRFDALGTSWLAIFDEFHLLTARHNTFKILSKYRLSFHPTLTESKFVEISTNAGSFDDEKSPISYIMDDAVAKGGTDGASTSIGDAKAESKTEESKNTSAISEGVKILNVEDNPDFLNLALEFQGYCPWTLIHGSGLLVPGKPALGVISWNNLYMVCDHAMALRDVAANPAYYFDAVKDKCIERPEYIHLLRMQHYFPHQSISSLLENPDFDPVNSGGKAQKVDASTETPTHFQESYFDKNYHWNEWELRKRALQVANLKNCRTTAQQTDNSHFTRDNASQVYQPKVQTTQTRKDLGTNPPVTTLYIKGLRGDSESKVETVQLKTDLLGNPE